MVSRDSNGISQILTRSIWDLWWWFALRCHQTWLAGTPPHQILNEGCFSGKIMELNDVCSSTPCLIRGVAAKLWQILTGKVIIYKWFNHQIWGTLFSDKPEYWLGWGVCCSLKGAREALSMQGIWHHAFFSKEDEPELRVTKTGADSLLISCCDW
jgi:hypothetical protein